MGSYQALAYGKPETRPAGPLREEWLEHMRPHVLGHSRAAVLHHQLGLAAGVNGHLQRASVGLSLGGVQDEVHDHLGERGLGHAHPHGAVREIATDLEVGEVAAEKAQGLLDGGHEIRGSSDGHGLWLAEGEESRNEDTEVTAGKVVTVTVTMTVPKPLTCALTVSTEPALDPTARVTIGGQTRDAPGAFELTAGAHTIAVERAGYEAAEANFECAEGAPTELTVPVKALTIVASVGGQRRAMRPGDSWSPKVSAGPFKVRLRLKATATGLRGRLDSRPWAKVGGLGDTPVRFRVGVGTTRRLSLSNGPQRGSLTIRATK